MCRETSTRIRRPSWLASWPGGLLALVGLLALASCASPGARNPFSAGGGGGDRTIHIAVENSNWSDITLYVEAGGALHRVGRVGSASQGRFKLPPGVGGGSGTFRFTARLLGGTQIWTPAFSLSPGSELSWQVGSSAATSHFMVRQ